MDSVAIRPGQLFIWHGPALFIADERGAAGPDDRFAGFYFREARYLSHLELRLNGEPPWPCAAARTGARELLIGLVYPELDGGDVPRRAIDLMLRYRLEFNLLTAELELSSHSPRPLPIELTWRAEADYADLLETSEETGATKRVVPGRRAGRGKAGLVFPGGEPRLRLETAVEVRGPAPWKCSGHLLASRLILKPQQRVTLVLRALARDSEAVPTKPELRRREARLSGWRRRRTHVSAPGDPAPVLLLEQAMEDLGSLALLEGEPEDWLAPAAGMPRYPALFGRDALTAGWQSATLDGGAQLEASLTRLGRLQGTRMDSSRDEAPGRIVHSVRRGPLARLGKNSYARYYGDQASPFMFIIGLAQLYAWRGGTRLLARHWDRACRILDWAREQGDRDGDGYIEYLTTAKDGPENQGWKDSGDAIRYEDGTQVKPPIAACEIQGYWFSAQQLFAALCAARGRLGDARAYWRSAQDLKARFNRDWWLPEQRCIGLALDPDKRLVGTVTSNAGHCLAAGIVNDEHVPPLVERLFQPDLWSGWGIRTLSSQHPSYHPVSYHLGSIWTVENATIAFGLRRYGFDARTVELVTGLFELARCYQDHRAPECVGGYARSEWPHPGAYPRANPLQAWNQSGMVMLLESLLALQPVAPLDLLVIDPVLPAWLPEITLTGLRVGGATATLRCWRDAKGKSHGEIVRKRGTLHLIRQPPPESLTASVRDRLSAFVDGVMHK